jgi:arylsulfatase A-like enzyme
VPGKGSSHGSLHPYDRTVPLAVRAPGRVPAGRRIDRPMSFRAFARTAAAILEVEPPQAAREGEDLTGGPRRQRRATSRSAAAASATSLPVIPPAS